MGDRKEEQRSRLKRLHDEKKLPNLPEVRLPLLIEYFEEVGPALASAFGTVPLTHVEIRAWEGDMGLELSPWEARTLKRLSMEYVTQKQLSEDPSCPPPYGERLSREAIAKKIDEVFR